MTYKVGTIFFTGLVRLVVACMVRVGYATLPGVEVFFEGVILQYGVFVYIAFFARLVGVVRGMVDVVGTVRTFYVIRGMVTRVGVLFVLFTLRGTVGVGLVQGVTYRDIINLRGRQTGVVTDRGRGGARDG